MSQQWLTETDNVPMYNTLLYMSYLTCQIIEIIKIVMHWVGVSGTTKNGQKEEWQWGGTSI